MSRSLLGSRDEFGQADNPVMHVRFYNPKSEDLSQAFSISDKKMSDLFTPKAFSERLLYVYTRSDKSFADIDRAYRAWRAQLQRVLPSVDLTPLPIANTASPRKRGRVGQRFN